MKATTRQTRDPGQGRHAWTKTGMNASLPTGGIVTAIVAGPGVMPVFIDLDRTHATYPCGQAAPDFILPKGTKSQLQRSSLAFGWFMRG